jgi:hypothetical protein
MTKQFTVIDASTGKVVISSGDRAELITQLSQEPQHLVVEKRTGLDLKEYFEVLPIIPEYVLFFSYPSTLYTPQQSTHQDELTIEGIANSSMKKASEFIASIYKQQALDVLCSRHLLSGEYEKYQQSLNAVRQVVEQIQHFNTEVIPNGVVPLVQKLVKTQCLPNDKDYSSLLDILNATGRDEESILKQQESDLKAKLDACKQYTSIQTVAVSTCAERLQGLQNEISIYPQGDDQILEAQDILEQQSQLLEQYYNSKKDNIPTSEDDDLSSMHFMNDEMIVSERLTTNDMRLKQMYEEFKLHIQKSLSENTPDQIYEQLLKWKQRMTTFTAALAKTVENRSHESTMNHIRCIAQLPQLYQDAKKELIRRKRFHSSLDKETVNYYNMTHLLVGREMIERSDFQAKLRKDIPKSDIQEIITNIFSMIGINDESDIIEVPSLDSMKIKKHPMLGFVTETEVRDDEWEQIDDFDLNEEESVSIATELTDIDIAQFGTESIFFSKAMNQIKELQQEQPRPLSPILSNLDTIPTNNQPLVVSPVVEQQQVSVIVDDTLKKELDNANSQIAKLMEEIEQLRLENVYLTKELSDSRCYSETQEMAQVARLSARELEIEEQRRQMAFMDELLASTRSEFEKNRREVLDLSTIIAEKTHAHDKAVHKFEDVISEMNHEHEREMESVIADNQAQLDAMKDLFAKTEQDYELKIVSLTKAMETTHEKYVQRTIKHEELLNQVTEQLVQSGAEKECLNLHIHELQQVLDERQSQIVQLEEEISNRNNEPVPVPVESPAVDEAQQKIKSLQDIVQKSASMVNEYMSKITVLNKATQDLSMNITLSQNAVNQLSRRVSSLSESLQGEENPYLRGVNMISQIGCMRTIVMSATEAIIAAFLPTSEQDLDSQMHLINSYNDNISHVLNTLSDILLNQFQLDQQSNSDLNTIKMDEDPSTISVSLNNFKENSKLLFFRSQRNREAFEAFNIGAPGFYLSPDSVEILKNRFGPHYASTYYCVGRIIYMEEAQSDVLRVGSPTTYTLVTVSFEE